MYKKGEKVFSLINDYKYDIYLGCETNKLLLKKGASYTILDPYGITTEELPNYAYSKNVFISVCDLRKKKLLKISECSK